MSIHVYVHMSILMSLHKSMHMSIHTGVQLASCAHAAAAGVEGSARTAPLRFGVVRQSVDVCDKKKAMGGSAVRSLSMVAAGHAYAPVHTHVYTHVCKHVYTHICT